LKTAMDFAGFAGGPVRAPLQRPNEAGSAEIAELLNGALSQALEVMTAPQDAPAHAG
jgi:dihydrodipicolinate synthase/N-acetylneuraminate lyase